MRVQHYDRIGVKFDRSTMREVVGGARVVDGVGAHVGNYTYHDDQGRPFVEHVPASTLFDPVSLDSAAGAPVTIRHPAGLVTAANYQDETHGTWVKAWDAGDGNLGVRLRLGSAAAIKMVDDAVTSGDPVELSPAYEVDVKATPGTTEHGRHDGVQAGRDYNAMAMLGPTEARGGPNMKLALDGPERAPAGSMIQVRAPRLDSGPGAVLPFATKRSDAMKKAIINYKGRRAEVSDAKLALARSMASHSDAVKADQIAVGRVLVEIEGEEPVDLMLPVAMIEMLLEGIGAGPAAAPPAEPMPEEEVALEAADAGDEDEKLDANLDAKIDRIVAAKINLRLVARDKRDARRVSVHSDAARVLPPAYDYEAAQRWERWALDGIARVAPDREPEARKHYDSAVKGDLEAAGRLRQMLADESRKHSDANGGIKLTTTKTEHDDAKPWLSPTMPKAEVKQ